MQGDAAAFDALAASRATIAQLRDAVGGQRERPAPTRAGWPAMRRCGSASSATSTRFSSRAQRLARARRRRAPRFSRSRRSCSPPPATSRAPCRRPISRPTNPISRASSSRSNRVQQNARALGPHGRRRRSVQRLERRRAVSRPVHPRPARRGRHARRRRPSARSGASGSRVRSRDLHERAAASDRRDRPPAPRRWRPRWPRSADSTRRRPSCLTRYRDTDVSIAAVAGDGVDDAAAAAARVRGARDRGA